MDGLETSPSFWRAEGLDPGTFVRACRKGATSYAGWPVGNWVVREDKRTVSHLEIPVEVGEQLLGLERGMLGREGAGETKAASEHPQEQRNFLERSGPRTRNGAARIRLRSGTSGTSMSPKSQALSLLARGFLSSTRALRDWLNGGDGA